MGHVWLGIGLGTKGDRVVRIWRAGGWVGGGWNVMLNTVDLTTRKSYAI